MTSNEHDNFPCYCHRPEYAYEDKPCPVCQELEDYIQREREDAERDRQMTMDNCCREADNDAFADACGQMTREDWDADNDWLASAGWGEM